MVTIIVDGREIETETDRPVLEVCRENGIYIPSLCYLKGMETPPATCRLCFVAVEGIEEPVPSCTVYPEPGMRIQTDTPEVRRLQRKAFKHLLSIHQINCGECHANRKCELQRLDRLLKIGLEPNNIPDAVDDSHPFLLHYPNKCVFCGRCIYLCTTHHGRPMMPIAGRGFPALINIYVKKDMEELPCLSCRLCADNCPAGALRFKDEFENAGCGSPDSEKTQHDDEK